MTYGNDVFRGQLTSFPPHLPAGHQPLLPEKMMLPRSQFLSNAAQQASFDTNNREEQEDRERLCICLAKRKGRCEVEWSLLLAPSLMRMRGSMRV